MKNIFIITQSEPFYIPKMIRHLAENQKKDYKIVGYTMLSPNRKSKSVFHWFKERMTIYTLWELFLVGKAFGYTKMINVFNKKKSPYNSKSIFSSYNVPRILTDDINSSDFISQLKTMNIDHVVSISCPQLFKEELIAVSKICSLNAHGTLLPRHKGVFGSWWTLFENDEQAGSTIHKLELKLDSGAIVWQKAFDLTNEDTQYSIAYKTKRDMSFGLVELFKNEKLTELSPVFEASYHRAPSRELGKQFHKNGKHILKFRDLKKMLSRQY